VISAEEDAELRAGEDVEPGDGVLELRVALVGEREKFVQAGEGNRLGADGGNRNPARGDLGPGDQAGEPQAPDGGGEQRVARGELEALAVGADQLKPPDVPAERAGP